MKIIPFVLALLLSFSCTSNIEQNEEDLKKEIMDIHDELMPKMDHIRTLKKELQKSREYFTNDSITADKPSLTPPDLDSLVQALENAGESMMVWMRNYNKFDEPGISHKEQMEYLQKEKEKIETVRLKMISSINEAENVLNRGAKPLEPEN